MSLEQKIQANTEAVAALTAVISKWFGQSQGANTISPVVPEAAPTRTPAPVEEAPDVPGAAQEVLTRADVAAAITSFVKEHGRPKACQVMSPWKTEKLGEIPESEWPAVYKAFTEEAAGNA